MAQFPNRNSDISTAPYNSNTLGRLTSVHYAGANCTAAGGNNYVEMFAYSQPGQVINKRLRLTRTGSAAADLEAVYSYDNEGRMTSLKYPLGTTYQYTFDNMGRPNQMTDTSNSQNLVSGVSYGPAGELLSMSGTSVSETRTYNVMGQLTQLTGTGVNVKYNYSASANNGQIASQQDVLSGETVTYQYDSLKRLTAAQSSQGWGQGFGYDGFGNLTAKNALSGAPPVGVYNVDATTNRLSGVSYDANGNQLSANSMNLTYDVANRTTQSTGTSLQAMYEYDASNSRVYQLKQSWNGSAWVTNAQEWYFYGIEGRRLGTYALAGSTWSLQSTQVFFQGKLVRNATGVAQEDIRGSVGRYYPYGEDRDNTANDAVKFGTYTRDSVTGLDYAKNRFYGGNAGRFSSPDPYWGSVSVGNPMSWNRYQYVLGDPINAYDPSGLGEVSFGNNCPASFAYCGIQVSSGVGISSGISNGFGNNINDGESYYIQNIVVAGSLGQLAPGQVSPTLVNGSSPTGSTSTICFCSPTAWLSAQSVSQSNFNATGQGEPLNGFARGIFGQINQNNPGGFVNAATALTTAGYGLGFGVTAAVGAITSAGSGGAIMGITDIVLDIGGEGQVAGAINFQPLGMMTGQMSNGLTMLESQALGNVYIVGSNAALPFAPGSIGTVITNSVPIFGVTTTALATWLGPTVQPSQIWMVLSNAGIWINNGVIVPRP